MARLICLASIIPKVCGPHQESSPKICKDCRHFTRLKMSSDGYCQCFVERDLVGGQVLTAVRASEARSERSWCGEEARFFEMRDLSLLSEEPQPPVWDIELLNRKTIVRWMGTLFDNLIFIVAGAVLIRVIFVYFFV